jgi:hypothetical protein
MLMQQVEELLLMDQLSEGEKVKTLQNARPNYSDGTPDDRGLLQQQTHEGARVQNAKSALAGRSEARCFI